ncbi:hypothetical protein [Halomicronema sp. CCY15110]|uniref:hypothetical protein n=1 Tax=Halomicronema sp. CCY15110 TaxID=2767773 RepID=UPI001EF3A0A5|nr:hypothetical protein [Halomicronema sp. CCY15110]
MLETEILQKMQSASIEERIRVIELLLQSLKQELVQNPELPAAPTEQPSRAPFGYMKNTGSIKGDIVSPVVPESEWEVLQ